MLIVKSALLAHMTHRSMTDKIFKYLFLMRQVNPKISTFIILEKKDQDQIFSSILFTWKQMCESKFLNVILEKNYFILFLNKSYRILELSLIWRWSPASSLNPNKPINKRGVYGFPYYSDVFMLRETNNTKITIIIVSLSCVAPRG